MAFSRLTIVDHAAHGETIDGRSAELIYDHKLFSDLGIKSTAWFPIRFGKWCVT